MNTMSLAGRADALRMRPLAMGLAAICAASVSFAGDATAGATNLRELASRFPQIIVPPAPTRPATAVTNCDDAGPGSLRDTVEAAVDGDTIDLSGLTCSRISLSTGAIVFSANSVAIEGPGENELMIDGTLSGAVLYHLGSGTLIVENLSIGYGFKYRSDYGVTGSCVHTQGNALLTNVRVTTCNTVSTSNYPALGGAIWAEGAVQLTASEVTMSEAHALGNGYASGGGVYALGGLVSIYSTLSNNVALVESTSTPSFGGGVFARGASLMLGSTVSGNQAWRMGGAAFADNTGLATSIVNSTVSGNFADTIGGVFGRGPLDIYNSTIAFNTSHTWTDGAGHYFAAGVYITTSGNLDSSIISNNVNTAAPFDTADATGTSGSGWNGSNNNVMNCLLPCPTDTSHEDPGLHPLMDNGGPTKTHVPTPGQWDIFGGTNLLNLTWEQRGPGFPRQSVGDLPEIGALQVNSDIIFANGFN
jgi:hypothetical protein